MQRWGIDGFKHPNAEFQAYFSLQDKVNFTMNFDFSKFSNCHLLVIGDLMIDEYVWGDVDRISPEAPVQVVSVKNEEYTLGGSGNVVKNLVTLGANVSVLGVTGTDPDAKLLRNILKELGVDPRGIFEESWRLTTKKTRIIAEHQQVLRIDRETKKEIAPQTFESLIKLANTIIPEVDIILISDYGKGVISHSLVARLISTAQNFDKMIIVDPKGLDFSKYSGVSLVTPNKKEASLASGIEIVDEKSLKDAGNYLLQEVGFQNLLITCGKDGMMFFEPGREPITVSTRAREVYDVSGAGDTVIAVLGIGLAAGLVFHEAIRFANTAAGIVVGKVGTAPVTRKELERALKHIPEDKDSKYKTLIELSELCKKLQKDRKRIVLTNGCFDLLHVGHVKLLSASKKLGDVLIVAIDDDESVSRLKGAGRPVINSDERVRILSALDNVDYVLVFSTNELDEIIKTIRPDVLTKGSNYESEAVFGREIVEKYGGLVELIPITEEVSSTQIINNIKNK